MRPVCPRITIADAIAFNNIDIAIAEGIDAFTLRAANIPSIPARPATTATIGANNLDAVLDMRPVCPRIARDDESASSNIDNAVAAPIADSGSALDNTAIRIVNAATIPVNVNNVVRVPFVFLVAFVDAKRIENAPIIATIDPVAAAKSSVSTLERITAAATITPIAKVRTTKLPTALSMPFAASVIIAIIPASMLTAVMPFTRFSTRIMLSSAATTANIPIDMDIISNVAPTRLRPSPPPASFVAAISPVTIPPKAATAIMPLVRASGFMPESILAVTASNNIAPDTARMVAPIGAILFAVYLRANIRAVTIAPNAVITNKPFTITPGSILAIIFIATAINTIAADIPSIVPPMAAISFPANLVDAIRPAIIMLNAEITTKPLPSSELSMPDIIFIISTNSIIASDICIKAPPIPLASPTNLVAAMSPESITPSPAIANIPFAMLLSSIPPSILRVLATMRSEYDKAKRISEILPKFIAEPVPNLPITAESPANIPARTANAPIAAHILPGSRSVRTTIAPTNIKMATAIVFNACAFTPSANASNALDVLSRTSPIPSNGSENASIAFASLSPVTTIPPTILAISIEPKSRLLIISTALLAMVLSNSHTVDAPF